MHAEPALTLRPVQAADLEIFFAQQLDPQANWMAAFTAPDPADRAAFDAHWARILNDAAVLMRTICLDQAVAGHIASFERWGEREVTYWLGREYWGRGLASAALRAFLSAELHRPLAARAALDNAASLRVLEKCGFIRLRVERGFADARGAEIDEAVLRLD